MCRTESLSRILAFRAAQAKSHTAFAFDCERRVSRPVHFEFRLRTSASTHFLCAFVKWLQLQYCIRYLKIAYTTSRHLSESFKFQQRVNSSTRRSRQCVTLHRLCGWNIPNPRGRDAWSSGRRVAVPWGTRMGCVPIRESTVFSNLRIQFIAHYHRPVDSIYCTLQRIIHGESKTLIRYSYLRMWLEVVEVAGSMVIDSGLKEFLITERRLEKKTQSTLRNAAYSYS